MIFSLYSTMIKFTPAIEKNVFGSGNVGITTVTRASVKKLFTSFYYNLYQFCTLKKKGIIQLLVEAIIKLGGSWRNVSSD